VALNDRLELRISSAELAALDEVRRGVSRSRFLRLLLGSEVRRLRARREGKPYFVVGADHVFFATYPGGPVCELCGLLRRDH
jgi:hypothetical protein